MNRRAKDFQQIYIPDRCDPLIESANAGLICMKGLRRYKYPGRDLPDAVLPGILSIGYWDAKVDQHWGLDWHRNEGIEFTFLESGNLAFATSKEQSDLVSGNFTITRPWQRHRVGRPNVTIGKLYWLIIDVGVTQPHQDWNWPEWIILSEEDLGQLTNILRKIHVHVWKSNSKLQDCFLEFGKCLDNAGQFIPHSKLAILINNLLLEMLNLFKKGEIELDESLVDNLKTVEVFVNDLLTDYEKYWTLESMAGHCGLGRSSLSKYCKQLTNMTPMNYLTSVRLDAASKLLGQPDAVNITDVGYACGFTSSQYFATIFKKHFHCTPSEYRRNVLAQKNLWVDLPEEARILEH